MAAAAEQAHRRTVAGRLLGPVPDRTASGDDDLRHRHRHRGRGDRSVPCGHRDGADPACTGQVVAVERTADGTDSGRTGRSSADGLRTRWGDSRDVVDRRADIRGSRSGAMAFPGGAACAAACDGRVEAADVPAVDGAAVVRSRSGEDRGHRGHRVAAAVGLAADRPMLGPVLRPRMGLKSEEARSLAVEDRPGEHGLVVAELELPTESVLVGGLVFVLEQRPVELGLAELEHGMVLAELVQQLALAVLESALPVYSQRVSPWKVLPISELVCQPRLQPLQFPFQPALLPEQLEL